MKKLIVVILLLIMSTGIVMGQREYLEPDKKDSLKTGRLAARISWGQSYLYTSVVFDQIAATDSVGIYAITDSLGPNHTSDTIKCYLRNMSTYAEYPNGLIDSVTSVGGCEIFILNPNIKTLFFRLLDAQTTKPTIYFRIRGVTF